MKNDQGSKRFAADQTQMRRLNDYESNRKKEEKLGLMLQALGVPTDIAVFLIWGLDSRTPGSRGTMWSGNQRALQIDQRDSSFTRRTSDTSDPASIWPTRLLIPV